MSAVELGIRREWSAFERAGLTSSRLFENGGAAGGSWAVLATKISDIAHERRGHDKIYFKRYWKTRIALTIAKRGVQAIIRRARELCGSRLMRAAAVRNGVMRNVEAEVPVQFAGGG